MDFCHLILRLSVSDKLSLPCFQSPFNNKLCFLEELLLAIFINVHNVESVLNDTFLDLVVKGSRSLEARGMINLNDIGLQRLGDHDINAQNMEAHATRLLLWLAVGVLVRYGRQP